MSSRRSKLPQGTRYTRPVAVFLLVLIVLIALVVGARADDVQRDERFYTLRVAERYSMQEGGRLRDGTIPDLETADVDRENNHWPPQVIKSRFKLFKEKKQKNDMQKARGDLDEDEDE